jgi:anti-sigma B factor antagonist
MELRIATAVTEAGRHTVTLEGAIDLQSRGELLAAGRSALAVPGASVLVLNLAGITFMDSTGIGAIVELAGETSDAGLVFALQDPSPRAARILELTGLRAAWTIEAADTV